MIINLMTHDDVCSLMTQLVSRPASALAASMIIIIMCSYVTYEYRSSTPDNLHSIRDDNIDRSRGNKL